MFGFQIWRPCQPRPPPWTTPGPRPGPSAGNPLGSPSSITGHIATPGHGRGLGAGARGPVLKFEERGSHGGTLVPPYHPLLVHSFTASPSMARIVHQEVTSGVHFEDKENVNPMLGDELEIPVQERHILVRCQPRRHPRIPLRDITHLFPGNVASLDDKTDALPRIQPALGNGPVRRPFSSSTSPQNSRKRRQAEPASETSTVRRVLRKFR